MKCISKDRNDKCCRFAIVTDTKFCKNHQYMKDYTDDMLTKLSLCSGCKKMYYLEGDTKTCDNCKARKAVNNAKAKQNAVPCSKDGCNNKKSAENPYCKLHQLASNSKTREEAIRLILQYKIDKGV